MIKISIKGNCSGCTACGSICPTGAISFVPDTLGFLYPEVNETVCCDCGRCEEVCPILNREIHEPETPVVYALRHKDRDILMRSSSGGAFFPLAKYIISRGGVVCGVDYDEQMRVVHSFAETLGECVRFQGSKYSQSDMRGIFHRIAEYLGNGRELLFTGTPCQVDGLKHYLQREGIDRLKLLTADLVCHSVPSPAKFAEYVEAMGKRYGSRVVRIEMRDKSHFGWGHVNSYIYTFADGRKVHNPKEFTCWQDIFESRTISRDSCFACRYTNFDRPGDFTIGDFWDNDNHRPDLKSKDGTSVIVVNSPKAAEVLDAIKDDVNLWDVDRDAYMQYRFYIPISRPE